MSTMFKKILHGSILLFIFLLPWQPIFIFHQETLGAFHEGKNAVWQWGTLGIALSDILALALIFISVCMAIAAYIKNNEHIFVSAYKEHKALFGICILFFISLCASLFFAHSKIVGVVSLIRMTEAMLLALCILSSKISLKSCMIALVLAGTLQGVVAGEQFFMQDISSQKWLGIAHHSPQELGDSVVSYGEYRWLRAYGSFPHPNIEGFFLALSLFVSFFLMRMVTKKREIYLILFCSLCITLGLFVTYSRSAWIGVAGTFFLWGVLRYFQMKKKDQIEKKAKNAGRRISPTTFFFISIVCMATVLTFIFSDLVATRYGVGGWKKLEQRSIQERENSFHESIGLMQKHPLGVGVGNYTVALFEKDTEANKIRYITYYSPVHSLLPLVATELGIQGLLFFSAILFSFLLFCIRILRHSQNGSDASLFGIGVFFLVFFVGLFDHFFWTSVSGIFVWWFCMACILLTKQETMIE